MESKYYPSAGKASSTSGRLLFGDARAHVHFLDLLGEMVERYGVALHAYCLMDTHYHLLVQTPNANLSRAIQWLNVSASKWINARSGDVGPVFSGRFKSVSVDGDGAWAEEVSDYIHLNPVLNNTRPLPRQSNGSAAA